MHPKRQKLPIWGVPSCGHDLARLLLANHAKIAVLVFAERNDAHLAPPTNNFLNSFSPPQAYHIHLASALPPFSLTSSVASTTPPYLTWPDPPWSRSPQPWAPLEPHSIYLFLYNHRQRRRSSRHLCLYYRCTYCAEAFLQVRSWGHLGLSSKAGSTSTLPLQMEQ